MRFINLIFLIKYMVKICAIGDFHGKFPAKLKKLAKNSDLVISLGDYPAWSLKKTFFKYCYKTDKDLWDILGKEKYKKVFTKDWKTAEDILGKLDSLGVPIFSIVGNYDYHKVNDSSDEKKINWKWIAQDFFPKTIKKYSHIRRFDYRAIKIDGIVLIGAYGGSFPGRIKSKAYRKYRKKLETLFKEYAKENSERRVIFVTHNVPYNCKLDKIRDKNAPTIVQGKHYGSKLIRRIINKYQPVICVCGHIHENQGRCKIGKTLVINTGAALDGKCAIIEFDEKKRKIKNVKFVK